MRAALLQRGMTLQEFADRHGFKYCTVLRVMRRHLGQEGSRPRGEKTLRILDTLNGYAGHKPSSPSKVGDEKSGRMVGSCEATEREKVASSTV